jgi:hypothetical protein
MRRFYLISFAIFLTHIMTSSCGNSGETTNGPAKTLDDNANLAERSSIAIEGEEDFAHLIVQMPADIKNLQICIGTLDKCEDPNAKLITLTKKSPGFWRSDAPVDVRTNFTAHVIRTDEGRHEIILSSEVVGLDSADQVDGRPGLPPRTGIELPPPPNLPKMRTVPGGSIAFDYQGTLSRAHPTAAVIRMIIQGGSLKNATQAQVTGTLINLRNSKLRIPLNKVVSVNPGNILDFTIDQLSPDTVYRLEGTKVFDASGGSAKPASAVSVRHPYHVATAEEKPLAKARRRLVLRAISESYDWDHGNYLSTKGYAAGSWCDRFYTWAAAKDFKVSNVYSAKNFFQQFNTLGNASRISSLAKSRSVAGDLIRYEGTSLGTHTLMIIAYDEALKSIWTVEGNYNNRVMRLKRGISSGWMHGHLIEKQVK